MRTSSGSRGRSMRKWCALVFLGLAGNAFALLATPPSDTALLMRNYMRFLLGQQVEQQIEILADEALPGDRAQVEAAGNAWRAEQMSAIRGELEGAFGSNSRQVFEDFVAELTTAEKNLDAEVLEQVSSALALDPAPADYASLRKTALENVMQEDLKSVSSWLGEVQMWMDLRRGNPDVPPLEAWLTRSLSAADAARSPLPSFEVRKPVPEKRLLDEAEAGQESFSGDEEEEASPLDSFTTMRQERRDRALQEAEAGMQQVAEERRAAEEEFAAKKLAQAQADAEAMRHQAEQLASAEQEALEQRKNSWGNRLKSIVSATIGAATGAFTGGIGTRAGQEAANAIFNN